jgi:hypothetical protein
MWADLLNHYNILDKNVGDLHEKYWKPLMAFRKKEQNQANKQNN